MTPIHELAFGVAVLLVGVFVAMGIDTGSFGQAVGPLAVLLVFVAVWVWMKRRGIGELEARAHPRPSSWSAPTAAPSPLIGGPAWDAATFDAADPEPLGPLDVQAAVVTDGRKRNAPVAQGLDLPTGPTASIHEHQAAIAALPEVLAWWNPMEWPVCCDRASVIWLVDPTATELEALESRAGPLDRLVQGPIVGRRARPHPVGCGCGRWGERVRVRTLQACVRGVLVHLSIGAAPGVMPAARLADVPGGVGPPPGPSPEKGCPASRGPAAHGAGSTAREHAPAPITEAGIGVESGSTSTPDPRLRERYRRHAGGVAPLELEHA